MMPPAAATVSGSTVPPYLFAFCAEIKFSAGAVVHRAGQRYDEMYLIVEGCLQSYLECDDFDTSTLVSGSTVGDLGFLGGYQARADVITKTKVRALVIAENTFRKIEAEDRPLAVHFRRFLANVTNERESPNYDTAALSGDTGIPGNINVVLCRDENMLLQAKRLRYSVDCNELGRNPPEADHSRKIITDDLDEFGHTFIAIERGEVIGTLRTNLAREGPLGIMEDLYGMTTSANHPAKTAVCTQFYIKKSKRGTPAFLQLGGAWLQDAASKGVLECFVAVVPSLAAPYKLLGFRSAAERFYYHGRGPSEPMVLDLKQHQHRLSGLSALRAHSS
jgi:hypothetical protein